MLIVNIPTSHFDGVEVGYGNQHPGGATVQEQTISFSAGEFDYQILVKQTSVELSKSDKGANVFSSNFVGNSSSNFSYPSQYNHTDVVVIDDGPFSIAWTAFEHYGAGWDDT